MSRVRLLERFLSGNVVRFSVVDVCEAPLDLDLDQSGVVVGAAVHVGGAGAGWGTAGAGSGGVGGDGIRGGGWRALRVGEG